MSKYLNLKMSKIKTKYQNVEMPECYNVKILNCWKISRKFENVEKTKYHHIKKSNTLNMSTHWNDKLSKC